MRRPRRAWLWRDRTTEFQSTSRKKRGLEAFLELDDTPIQPAKVL